MGAVVAFVGDVLAVWRLTRLVTSDTISEGLRDRVAADPRLGLLAEGLECDWCVSVWASGLVVGLGRLVPGVWQVLRLWLVLAMLVGLLAERAKR